MVYGGASVVAAHVLHAHEGCGVGGVPAAERERRDQVRNGAADGRREEDKRSGADEVFLGRGWPGTC